MLRPSKSDSQKSLFFSLGDSLDQNHPLYILAENIAWDNIPFTGATEDIARNTKVVSFGSLAQRNASITR